MNETQTKPGIEERYTSATDASNLRVEADRGGDADLLIANGWSRSRLGASLMRLHSEWDGAEKPRKATEAEINLLALTFAKEKSIPKQLTLAREQAARWHLHELKLLFGKLKSLPEVRQQVAIQAAKWRVFDPVSTAGAVIGYWLDQTCHVCDGRKWQSIMGSPGLSSRICQACHGSGISKTPHGEEGRKLANYLDDCVSVARASIKHRLHSFPHRG